MFNKLKNLEQNFSVSKAAIIVGFFTLLSKFVGLVRDPLLAGNIGVGDTLDIYYAAFRIPDFLFATVASLLSLYALLPVLTRLEQKNPGYLIAFLRDTLWVFFVGMAFIALIIFIFVPELVNLVAPGIAADPSSGAQLILLVRILL